MSRYIRLMISVFFAVVCVSVGLAAAQADEIGYGDTITGTIDDASPEHTYTFTAAEGDVITIAHTVTSGDLDPLLILADANGTFITRDDDSGEGRSSLIRDFIVPADGTYRIIATRYDGANGDTSGEYTLTLSTAGMPAEAPASAPAADADEFGALPDLGSADYTILTDGESADGDISAEVWGVAYVFGGHADDTVSINLARTDGDLALRVELLDQAGLMDRSGETALATAEDDEGTGTAHLSYTLTETAYYVIGVGRVDGMDGTTTGSYTITLALTHEADATPETIETPEPAETPEAPEAIETAPAIEITLSWNTTADLDLVLQYFPAAGGDPIAIDWHNVAYPEDHPLPEGAAIDTDANRFCRDISEQPRETITWTADTAPTGNYEVIVMYSSPCEGTVSPVEFELTYTVDGTVQTVTGAMAEPRTGEYRVTFAR